MKSENKQNIDPQLRHDFIKLSDEEIWRAAFEETKGRYGPVVQKGNQGDKEVTNAMHAITNEAQGLYELLKDLQQKLRDES